MEAKKINWSEYNKELINSGSLTFWFDLGEEKDWYEKNKNGEKGRPYKYSWLAIELLCVLKIRFGLPLRGVQGFAKSLLKLMGLNLEIPYFSTIGRRMEKLDVEIYKKIKTAGNLNVAIDSSGLKVYGEGEWKVKIHGRQKHRTWRKLHLAVDNKNNKIINGILTTNNYKDSEIFPELINSAKEIKTVFADGAYESRACYENAADKGIKAVIPPRKNAKISRRGSMHPRDVAIREIKAKGRSAWRKENDYHQRSLSETAFSRLKIIMGDKLSSRKFENQATEARIKCKILNRMTTPKGFG